MGIQLPGGPHPWSVNPEQSLDHGHAGQGSQREPLPRTGRRAPAEQHPMALLPVEPGQVELARQIQHVQLDPVLEGLAGQPQRPCVKQDETVSEAAPQHAQPRTGRIVDEHDQDRRAGRWPAVFVAGEQVGGTARGAPAGARGEAESCGTVCRESGRCTHWSGSSFREPLTRVVRIFSYIPIRIGPVCQVR